MNVQAIENIASIKQGQIYEAEEIDGRIIKIHDQWWNLNHFKKLEETNESQLQQNTNSTENGNSASACNSNQHIDV